MEPIKAVEDFIHDNFTGDKYFGTADMLRQLVREVSRDAVKGASVVTNISSDRIKELEARLVRIDAMIPARQHLSTCSPDALIGMLMFISDQVEAARLPDVEAAA